MVTGLAGSLPTAMVSGLTAHHVPQAQAMQVAGLPPVAVLFASLLGYNPIQSLLGPSVIHALPGQDAAYLTGRSFFPSLISAPFHDGLVVAFGFAIVACLVAAAASWLRGAKYVHTDEAIEQKAEADALEAAVR
jgi:hypothetical protein